MITAVIDTNILVAAMRSRQGASYRLIDEFMTLPTWNWSISQACLLEYEELLHRQQIPAEIIDSFLGDLLHRADKISRVQSLRPLLNDPDDEFLAELVLSASADYLVTFNKSHFRPLECLGVQLATPAEFLNLITRA
jgi:putative PIN family toxin of toxin-antitoxin system